MRQPSSHHPHAGWSSNWHWLVCQVAFGMLSACGSSGNAAPPPAEPPPVVVDAAAVAPAKPRAAAKSTASQSTHFACPLPAATEPPPDCTAADTDPFNVEQRETARRYADRTIRRLQAGLSHSPGTADSIDAQFAHMVQVRSSMSPKDSDYALVSLDICHTFTERATAERADSIGTTPGEQKFRKQAEACYRKLIADFPSFPRIDPAYAMLALTLERLGRLPDARKAYDEVIRRFPHSAHVPRAYFAFGEMYYRDAQSDPSKWHLAERAFIEVLKYPPSSNDLYGAALVRLASTSSALGNHEQALSHASRFV